MVFNTPYLPAVIFVTVFVNVNFSLASIEAPEGNLVSALMNSYPANLSTGGVPTTSADQTTAVNAIFSITDVPDIDDKKSAVSVVGTLELSWNDPFLQWPGLLPRNEVNSHPVWKNIELVELDSSKVWTPKILHSENTRDINIISKYGNLSPLLVRGKNGTVEWKVTAVINSRCDLNLLKFPFDVQSCTMTFRIPNSAKFGNGSYIRIPADRQSAVDDKSALWTLSEYSASVESGNFLITLNLKRRPDYYVWNMLVPLSITAVLPLTPYLLPPFDSLRSVHSVSCLLAYCFFLVAANNLIPKTSQVVLVGYYSAGILAIGSFTAFYCCIIAWHSIPKELYGRNEIDLTEEQYSKIHKIDKIALLVALCLNILITGTYYTLSHM